VDPYEKPKDLLEVSPRGLVPGLKLNESSPPRAVSESEIIMLFIDELAESQGKPALLPKDLYARSVARYQADHVSRHLVPAFYRYLQAQEPEKHAEGAKEFVGTIEKLVDLFEKAEKECPEALGLWKEGNSLGWQDVMAVPWLYRMDKVLKPYRGFQTPSGDKFNAYLRRLFAHPAVAGTCSDDELYLDSYARYAENRPNTSQVANAINKTNAAQQEGLANYIKRTAVCRSKPELAAFKRLLKRRIDRASQRHQRITMASTSKFTPIQSSSKANADLDPVDTSDIDAILAAEASNLVREEEAMRILKAFKLNPYEILDLETAATDDEIHKVYRKKSLMIHPDRFKHARGPEAFDLLKKAETELLDVEKRKNLDRTIADARMLILRGLGVPPEAPDSHDKLRFLLPPLRERVKAKTKEIMIDDELRRRRGNKMQMIAEGAEAQRVEKAQEERKRKMEDKAAWEDSRETRVTDWRSFQKGGKKAKRPKVLG
ncbi:hypothetical protein EMMF5_004103, partial [Cystobasidiomycetes sp. EMM_F5]